MTTAEKPDPAVAAAVGDIDLLVTPSDLLRLAEATPRAKIQQRPGPHSKWCEKPCNVRHDPLDYVTARYVMDFLDNTVGPANWQSKHTMAESGKVQCSLGIRVLGEWVWKSDGAGETDIEAEKGSFSKALVRAAVSWGIARDLYPDADNHQGAASTQGVTPSAAGRAPRPAADPSDYDSGNDDGPVVCPFHHKELRNGRYGLYCSGQGGNGPLNGKGYCDWKPGR